MLAWSTAVTVLDVQTPHGLARAHVVLGHGAGGSVSAPDLPAVVRVALEDGAGAVAGAVRPWLARVLG